MLLVAIVDQNPLRHLCARQVGHVPLTCQLTAVTALGSKLSAGAASESEGTDRCLKGHPEVAKPGRETTRAPMSSHPGSDLRGTGHFHIVKAGHNTASNAADASLGAHLHFMWPFDWNPRSCKCLTALTSGTNWQYVQLNPPAACSTTKPIAT